MTARNTLTQIYFDYVNNYLTPDKYADHNGLTVDQAKALLSVAKDVFYSEHPDA